MPKDNIIEIFRMFTDYLKEKDSDSRPEIIKELSLNNIPECFINKDTNKNNYWIKISKSREPKLPVFKAKNELVDLWADKETLKDESSTPRLKQAMFINGKTIHSDNYPQIKDEFKQYIEKQWLDDIIEYKEQLKAYEQKKSERETNIKLYNDLYEFYNSINNSDHILCLSVARVIDNDKIIPIINCSAEMELDNVNDSIEIRPDIENISLSDIIFINGYNKYELIEAEIEILHFLRENNITNDIFNDKVKTAVSKLSEKLGISNEHELKLLYQPSLLLRNKKYIGLSGMYDKISELFIDTESLEEVNYSMEEEESPSEQRNYTPVSSTETKDNQIRFNPRPDLLSMNEFLVFTNLANVYKIQNKAISQKFDIIRNIEFEHSEKPIYVTGTRNYNGYLLVAFENGKMGKITLESYKTEFNRKKIKNAYNTEVQLIFIDHIENDIDLVAISSINKIILFNTSSINPVGSKTTKGFQVMKSKDRSYMSKIKKLEQVKFADQEYYKRGGLNVVGFYLKPGDEI